MVQGRLHESFWEPLEERLKQAGALLGERFGLGTQGPTLPGWWETHFELRETEEGR